MASAAAQHLANSVWALARWRAPPPPNWWEQFWLRLLRTSADVEPANLVSGQVGASKVGRREGGAVALARRVGVPVDDQHATAAHQRLLE